MIRGYDRTFAPPERGFHVAWPIGYGRLWPTYVLSAAFFWRNRGIVTCLKCCGLCSLAYWVWQAPSLALSSFVCHAGCLAAYTCVSGSPSPIYAFLSWGRVLGIVFEVAQVPCPPLFTGPLPFQAPCWAKGFGWLSLSGLPWIPACSARFSFLARRHLFLGTFSKLIY